MPYLRDREQRAQRATNFSAGVNSLKALTTGHTNVALGLSAGECLTTGFKNVAIGENALCCATTGCQNIAIGRLAMYSSDVTGIDNIAIGTSVMDALTTGICNIAIGINALGASTSGCFNIAIGRNAMGVCDVTGQGNVAIGVASMDALTTGFCNIAIGVSSLGTSTTGCFNVAIGDGAGSSVTTESCTINIGCGANQTTAGVACIVATCLMSAQFTATSDCRSKCKIKDLPFGLEFINLLRPVSYKWKPQADKLDKNGNLIEEGERNHTHKRTMFGLLGQQVKEALTTLGLGYNDFAGFSDQEYENRNNPNWKKSYTMEDKTIQLTYDDFISPLIKSVQELSAEVNSLKAQLKMA